MRTSFRFIPCRPWLALDESYTSLQLTVLILSHPVFYGDLVYKLRRVKYTPNFFSSGSKIVKRLRRRQYDQVIIERTIGLVLGPSTAVHEPFLKHCTLTNKAMGTIWRALGCSSVIEYSRNQIWPRSFFYIKCLMLICIWCAYKFK